MKNRYVTPTPQQISYKNPSSKPSNRNISDKTNGDPSKRGNIRNPLTFNNIKHVINELKNNQTEDSDWISVKAPRRPQD